MAKFAEPAEERYKGLISLKFLDPFIRIVFNAYCANNEIEERDNIEAGLKDLNYHINNEEIEHRLPPVILQRCTNLIYETQEMDDASISMLITNIYRFEITNIEDLESLVTSCLGIDRSKYEGGGSDPSSYGEESLATASNKDVKSEYVSRGSDLSSKGKKEKYCPQLLASYVKEMQYHELGEVSIRSSEHVKPVKGIFRGSSKATMSHVTFDTKPYHDPLDRENIHKAMKLAEGTRAIVSLIRSYKSMGFKVGGEYSKISEDGKTNEYPKSFKYNDTIDYLESLLPHECAIPVCHTKLSISQERLDSKISKFLPLAAASDIIKILPPTHSAPGFAIWVREDLEHKPCFTIPLAGASDE